MSSIQPGCFIEIENETKQKIQQIFIATTVLKS